MNNIGSPLLPSFGQCVVLGDMKNIEIKVKDL